MKANDKFAQSLVEDEWNVIFLSQDFARNDDKEEADVEKNTGDRNDDAQDGYGDIRRVQGHFRRYRRLVKELHFLNVLLAEGKQIAQGQLCAMLRNKSYTWTDDEGKEVTLFIGMVILAKCDLINMRSSWEDAGVARAIHIWSYLYRYKGNYGYSVAGRIVAVL